MDDAEFVQLQADNQVILYALVGGLALLSYDTLLTLDQEIRFIWRERFRVGSVLYLLSKYFVIFNLVIQCVFRFLPTETIELCDRLVLTAYTVFIISEIGLSGILLGRAWAISGRYIWKKALLLFLFVLSLGMILSEYPFQICSPTNGDTLDKIAIAQSISVLAFDATVVVLTIHSTWRNSDSLRRVYLSSGDNETSLTVLFLRQGVFRFIIVFCWVLEIAIGDRVYRRSLAGVDITPERAVSSILLCRFMLQLRERTTDTTIHSNDSNTINNQVTSIPAFKTILSTADSYLTTEFRGDYHPEEDSFHPARSGTIVGDAATRRDASEIELTSFPVVLSLPPSNPVWNESYEGGIDDHSKN